MSDNPIPVDEIWWNGVKEERLLFQTCDTCSQVNFYPRIRCVKCLSRELTWRESTRHGTVYACTKVHRAPSAELAADVPYFVVLAVMDEGFRFMARLAKSMHQNTEVGDRVAVVFEESREGKKLPCFGGSSKANPAVG